MMHCLHLPCLQAKKPGRPKRSAEASELGKHQQEALLEQLRTKVVVLQDQLQQLMPQMIRMEQASWVLGRSEAWGRHRGDGPARSQRFLVNQTRVLEARQPAKAGPDVHPC